MSAGSTTDDYRTLLEHAYHSLTKLRSQVDALESARTESIAVIGMGCRFPGGASTPERYWSLLRDGVDAIVEVPPARWDIDQLYDPDPETPGKMSTRWGGFITEWQPDSFDARFFGINPREASTMDPQQRLLLEVTWEALEDAGQVAERLSGSRTGVFVGICSNDYQMLTARSGAPIDAYVGTGNAHSVASGRISYALGLQGPSISVDTACSSSLVALHLACQSLRTRESEIAIVGGVNLMLSPEVTINFSKARMMAADGRCKVFDKAADGYVRGEGCGVVILKRLSDARRDDDRILALIRGSAVNQDGRSSGLTVPNGPAQEAVLREALKNAGVEATDVTYVEAHGTGTALGDPIEMGTLTKVYVEPRDEQDAPLYVGSVKTNVGHLEAAAGMAGLIKVILSLGHAQFPAHLHFHSLNSHIAGDFTRLRIPVQTTPWNVSAKRRIAGLSSFGFSGTNAHAIIEEARHTPPSKTASPEGPHLLTLSARTSEALEGLVDRWRTFLQSHPADTSILDIAYTASARRSHMEYRLATVFSSRDDLTQQLTSFRLGKRPVSMSLGRAIPGERRRVVFLFSDAGDIWPELGHRLMCHARAFRDTMNACDVVSRRHLNVPVVSNGKPVTPRTNALLDMAPLRLAVQLSIAALWRSWGIEPDRIIGHGILGEVSAACAGGAISIESAAQILRAWLCTDRRQRLSFNDVACKTDGNTAMVPMDSTAEGVEMHDEIIDATYWIRRIATCRPTEGIRQFQMDAHDTLLAMVSDSGLRSTLTEAHRRSASIPQILDSIGHDEDERVAIQRALGTLYVAGHRVDWRGVLPEGGRCVSLPAYAWIHRKFWIENGS